MDFFIFFLNIKQAVGCSLPYNISAHTLRSSSQVFLLLFRQMHDFLLHRVLLALLPGWKEQILK